MKITTLIFLFVINISFSQTNQQLIDSIIKGGAVETDCVGIACQEGKQYLNFQKLKSRINEKELIELSNHENSILRIYASIDLIESNKGNVVAMFSNELMKKDTVPMVRGCIIEDLSTASIIYNEYRGRFIFSVYAEDLSINETQKKIDGLLKTDQQLKKLDSIILNTENDLDWLFYARIFENRIFKESDLKIIEKMAFEYNNSYAMLYLKSNHPKL